MFDQLQLPPAAVAAIWGMVGVIVAKALDWAFNRAKANRESRDELRADLALQIKRRQESEAEAEKLRGQIKQLRAELEDAEHGSRFGREIAEQFARYKTEQEAYVQKLLADHSAALATQQTARPVIHGPLDGVRVLVVEDDFAVRDFLAAALTEAGADVIACGGVPSAVDAIQTQRFDVIVSDIKMPGQSGLDLLRRVRALSPERGGRTPAVAVTAYGLDEDRAAALAAGYAVMLEKPIDAPELILAVESLVEAYGGREK